MVAGYPLKTRFARIVVHPSVQGGNLSRMAEYREAAEAARQRCFIGRTLKDGITYAVGEVRVAQLPRRAASDSGSGGGQANPADALGGHVGEKVAIEFGHPPGNAVEPIGAQVEKLGPVGPPSDVSAPEGGV